MPFAILKFDSVDDLIKIVFPDIEAYLQDKSSSENGSDLVTITYFELERRLKLFIVRNYSESLNEYLKREAKHTSIEAMKDVLLSTISLTLSVTDALNNRLSTDDYLISIRGIMKKIGVKY
jgi:hypothetical protein